MTGNRSYLRFLAIGLTLSILFSVMLTGASCNKTPESTVQIIIPSASPTPEETTTPTPTVTPSPTPIPEYRVGTIKAGDETLIYVYAERNNTSRIIGASVEGIDFLVTDEGTVWTKVLFGEDEEGYLETRFLDVVTSTIKPNIHPAYFYMPAKEEMGEVHIAFSGRLKVVPSTYIVIEKLPESDAPDAPLVDTEVTKTRIDLYSTSGALLAADTTLYLKNAVIKTTPLPTPSPTPTPETTPTPEATPEVTPEVTPSDTAPTETTPPETTPETSAETTPPTAETTPPETTLAKIGSSSVPDVPADPPTVLLSSNQAFFETTETTAPTPTPEPVEIIISNGEITSVKGVTLDQNVEFTIGEDKGQVITENGSVICFEGLFFQEAEVTITNGKFDTPEAQITIDTGYLLEPRLQKDNLVDVKRFTDEIYIDMMLAKDENIAGGNVYGQQICLLQRGTLDKLLEAQEMFEEDGYSIIIYDAYRPYSVTSIMYDIHQNGTYVAGKRFGSIHNRGAAIDMSLIDNATGEPIEMPSPIHTLDSRSNRSNPNMTETARTNMNYMAEVMVKCGFTYIASEWWHFTDLESNTYLRTDHKLSEQIKIIYAP